MCGFVGIVSTRECAGDVLLALQALQHRGQDSAGVGMLAPGHFPLVKHLGLVSQGFSAEDLRLLPGRVGLGHVRYPTVGKGLIGDTQPFFYRQPGVLMAHNGNFMNVPAMHEELLGDSIHLLSRCDVEPVLCLFARELMRRRRREHSVDDALQAMRLCFEKARGAYSLVACLRLEGKETLLALRGPYGIRPAVWGSRGADFVVASESVALDLLGARRQGDVEPGEMLVLRAGEEPQRHQVWDARPAPCVFEYIYFARPDSIMNGESVYTVRRALGEYLAKAVRAKGIQADVVIPIPDTSRPAAGALAEALQLPYREGFIKNRYTGRTFIMASTSERQNALKMKLNPIRSEFAGRRVLVVDDSIVRGTTLNHTIQLIREQGATQVHLAIYSPPVMYPCYYGIDMSTREELAAARLLPDHTQGPLNKEQLRELEGRFAARLGLDSLTYLPIAGLRAAFDHPQCAACFDGVYPLPPTDQERAWIEEDRRACDQRELRF
ncbi:MAG TPA: amidophosphoribosyltransferase [Myxococcota bacterium]|nr:amidophosphoribosyltransferase [Myxococcota bacterium]HRY95776.1 amidophosphoribosyltransferase [Myxococcota bacterium]HSA20527.1 amidophosphoribosyltransferase [Myxococcota bacterium]